MLDVAGAASGLVGLVLLGTAMWAFATYFTPVHDTIIYLLSGLRVNTGGEVYHLRPTDYLPALDDDRSAPMYSPPLLVVPMRLLVLLGGWGGLVWIALAMFVGFASIAYSLLITRGWAGWIIAPLAIGIASALLNGNIDCLVLGGMFVAWRYRDDPRVGALIALLALAKLTPAVLVIWLVATRRWDALRWCIGAGLVLVVASSILIEPFVWVHWLGSIAQGTSTGRSVALLAVAGGLVAILVLGKRYPEAAWVAAIALIPFGSPQSGPHTAILLLGCLAPLRELRRS